MFLSTVSILSLPPLFISQSNHKSNHLSLDFTHLGTTPCLLLNHVNDCSTEKLRQVIASLGLQAGLAMPHIHNHAHSHAIRKLRIKSQG